MYYFYYYCNSYIRLLRIVGIIIILSLINPFTIMNRLGSHYN